MAPRLRLLLLASLPQASLLAGGCAPEATPALALSQAFETGRATLGPTLILSADPPGTRPAAARELLGAGPEALRRWLGEPNLRRTEGAAEVWLYTASACALDLVLYPQRDGLRVAHAAARASGAEARTEAACLRELAALPGQRPIPAAGAPPVADRGA